MDIYALQNKYNDFTILAGIVMKTRVSVQAYEALHVCNVPLPLVPKRLLAATIIDVATIVVIVALMLVWSKRGNINTADLVTTAQCNTLVARCSRQLIGPADWVFVTLGPLRCD